MNKRMNDSMAAVLAIAAALTGCMQDKTLRTNNAPEANAGPDQQVDLEGDTARVKLDGHKSSDRDGEVVKYIWRNAITDADGGAAWATGDFDPDDKARPELDLPQGQYTFTLWVVDNEGATSEPAQVKVSVGTDPIAQCVADSLPVVGESCLACTCATMEGCVEATVACREDCWGLINCIVQNGCASGDTNCIIAACGPFLSGAMTATAVGPCVTPCASACGSGGGGAMPDGGTPDGG